MIIESFRLESNFKIIESNHKSNTAKSTTRLFFLYLSCALVLEKTKLLQEQEVFAHLYMNIYM